jgi:dienelactone hydrolase
MNKIASLALSACLAIGMRLAYADTVPEGLVTPPVSLNEQVLTVPGDAGRPVALQVTLYIPSGAGPFPLAVMNHGSTGGRPAAEQPRYRISFPAYYFLSRGYAVALPMMRGYAGSGGHLRGHGCDLAAVGVDSARDIAAVIQSLRRRPDIDASRVIVAGQSFGGWNTLALGALDVPQVKGLISFAGGVKSSDCDHPDQSLIAAAGQLGAVTRIPSLWFFGDNDAVFTSPTWRSMYEHYTAAGGPAKLVAFGRFGLDSHNMLGSADGLRIWVPQVDAFLASVGLPHNPIYPGYLPSGRPPATTYAQIDDVDAVPYLNEQARALYRAFLTKPLPRAFAVGTRSVASFSEGFDPRAQALKSCNRVVPDCRLYAVDHDVVWTKPAPGPSPTRFAPLADAAAVPYLNVASRVGYEKFLAMPLPRAFAVAPDGSWYAVSRGPDPNSQALATCAQHHVDCSLYAVDRDVVWTGKSGAVH